MSEVKLIHLVGSSKYGGGAQVILPLGEIARSQGWQVDVLATDATFQAEIRKAGLGVVDLDVVRREVRPWRDTRDVLRLARFLRAEKYTIAHTHTSKGGVVGRLAARLAGVPVIVHTVHGFAFHEASGPLSRLVYSRVERLAARWCDSIVTVSEFHKRWALDLNICHPGKITAIPNGLAAERVEPSRPREAVRRELGVSAKDYLILSTGRLAPQKGFAHLIRAAMRLPPLLRRRFHVMIAGDGPLREPLEQLSRSLGADAVVTFLGFRHDVGDMLAAADLVVLPSLWEGLSIALLEAMAAGKPIVTTRIGSNLEVCSHGEIALLVDAGDEAQLAEAIARCANDPALSQRIACAAREVFARAYAQERMLEGYLKIYRESIHGKRVAPAAEAEAC